MAKVSIIVPVYNTEKMLEKCVESLENQTLEDIEIILVDDGSPDNAGALCDKLAAADDRIAVIHKKNGGLSSARNAGLEIARGDFIGFIDSDDYVSDAMFEKMYNSAVSNKSDIVMCAHYTVNEDGCSEHLFNDDIKEVYEKNEIRENWIEPFIGMDRKDNDTPKEGFVWRQLFKRNVIKNIRFKSEREYFAEDIVFDLDVYPLINRISVVNEPLLYYVFNGSSLSNKYRKHVWNKLENLLGYEKKHVCSESAERRYYDTALKFVIFSFHNLKKKDCDLSFFEKTKEMRSIRNSACTREMLEKLDINLYDKKTKIFLNLLKAHFIYTIYFFI